MTCQHQFQHIKQTRRPSKNVSNINSTSNIVAERWDDEYGAMSGCVLCGETRTIWENGELEINKNGETSNT